MKTNNATLKVIFIIAAIVLGIVSATASGSANSKASASDTVYVTQQHVERIVTDTTTTAKGKTRIDYYAITTDGKILKTNKTTAKTIDVANKNGVTLDLKIIKGKRITY